MSPPKPKLLSLSSCIFRAARYTPRSRRPRRRNAPRAARRRTTATLDIDLENLTPQRRSISPQIVQPTTAVNTELLEKVNAKVDGFFQSGSFVSSDEEDDVMKPGQTKNATSSKMIFLSDDSDDEVLVVDKPPVNTVDDSSEPSTSKVPVVNLSDSQDDIMAFVDQVLKEEDCSKSSDKAQIIDLKSLEEYRKITEDMLKDASSLLDEWAKKPTSQEGQRATAAEPNKDSNEKVVTVRMCPICLESLADRPAASTTCGHIFCKECITTTAKTIKKCPSCRKNINMKKIHPIYF